MRTSCEITWTPIWSQNDVFSANCPLKRGHLCKRNLFGSSERCPYFTGFTVFIKKTVVVLFAAGGNEGDDEDSSDESASSEEGEGGAGEAGVKPGADTGTGSNMTPAAAPATADGKAPAASAGVVQASGDGESQQSAEKPAAISPRPDAISPRPPDVNHSPSKTVAAGEGGGNHVKPATTAEVVGNNSNSSTGNSPP
jgi:hypothetical protein